MQRWLASFRLRHDFRAGRLASASLLAVAVALLVAAAANTAELKRPQPSAQPTVSTGSIPLGLLPATCLLGLDHAAARVIKPSERQTPRSLVFRSQANCVKCSCDGKVYPSASDCLPNCEVTLGCFTGICGPATDAECASLDAISSAQKKNFQRARLAFDNLAYTVTSIGTVILFVPCGYCQVLGASQIVIGILLMGAGRVFDNLASDPPDPNFTEIASPTLKKVPLLPITPMLNLKTRRAISRLAQELQFATVYAQALLTSIERSQGAAAESMKTWQAQQLRAGARFARHTATSLRRARDAARGLRTVLRTGSVTEAKRFFGVYHVRTAAKRVLNEGLPTDVSATVTRLLGEPPPTADVQELMRGAIKTARKQRLIDAHTPLAGTAILKAAVLLEQLARRLEEQASALG